MVDEIIIYDDNNQRSLSTEVKQQGLSPVRAYLNTLSHRSRNTSFQALKKFATIWLSIVEEESGQVLNYDVDIYTLDWFRLSYSHMSMVRAKIGDMIQNREVSASYSNIIMAAVKGVLKECQRMGFLSREELANITDFKSFKVNHKKKGTLLSVDEVRALISVCDNSENKTLGIRDAAMISVLASTGMRRQELCSLRIEDINLNTRRVQIVGGKGDKNRVVFLSASAVKRVRAWFEIRPTFENNTFLFLPVMRYGQIANRQLSSQTVQLALENRAKEAGIKEIHPHDLRKFFGTTLLLSGADIAETSKLLGHANLSTTIQHYDLRNEQELQKTADKLPNIEFE